MLDFYRLKQTIQSMGEVMNHTKDALNYDKLCLTLQDLTEKLHADGVWNDVEYAQKLSQNSSETERKINRINSLVGKIADCQEMLKMLEELNENDNTIENEIKMLENEIETLSIETLLRGKYDNANAILTIHAGAGGTEAQDWAEMLYRMYCRYAERQGYSVKVVDFLEGDGAGIKSITFEVNGVNAYGYLKVEKGVHRLVRISPFDANKRRHTSFASLEVMPEITDDSEIKINSEELRIDTYRSGGAGGQHVNKTDSAIRITHLPSGIVVQCQNERSQIQNKDKAMKMLMSKLIEKKEREQLEQSNDIKGEIKKIEWGSQIRSYVFCPYTMVKDHRTNFENTNVNAVMDGEIEGFIIEYLKRRQEA